MTIEGIAHGLVADCVRKRLRFSDNFAQVEFVIARGMEEGRLRLVMKSISLLSALIGISLVPCASHGILLITELNSNASGGDFFEITNFGSSTEDISGFSWDDNSDAPDTVVMPAGTQIAPGESVIILADTDAAAFRTAWGLAPTVQVIVGSSGDIPGLGSNDRVTVFNTADQAVLSFNYAASGFTRSDGTASVGGHAGLSAGGTLAQQSAIFDPTFPVETPRFTFATGANFGSYDAPGGDGFGSPGLVPEPSTYAAILGALVLGLGLIRHRK